jgi:phage anti-repressor protein
MNTEEITQSIAIAAQLAQLDLAKNTGELYDLRDLKQAYMNWFNESVTVLLQECVPKAIGTNPHQFNQHAFVKHLNRAKSVVAEELQAA